ncbi:MAG: hypothetical protein ABL879_19965, partial [Devosia sp.]
MRRLLVGIVGSFVLLACRAEPAPAPVTQWTPAQISSPQFESHPAFDPVTGDLWFVRSRPDFTDWQLYVSPCGATGWRAPSRAPISGDGVDADPWFSPDGATLWFISNRSAAGISRTDTDIWRATRIRGGRWSAPERLPAPINSEAYEWYPRIGPDGWLYFGSGRSGGLGNVDIWRARQSSDGAWRVENAGSAINTSGGEYEAQPSADGRFMIVEADDGYYRSERGVVGWSERRRLGPEINVNGSEIGAAVSPSGWSMLFARATSALSGELCLVRWGAGEAWPPTCPRR